MTPTVLSTLDPSSLPPKLKAFMEAAGSFLGRGYSNREIGQRLDPPRSEGWVKSRVAEVRAEMARQALENAGDELDDELRTRLERFAGHADGEGLEPRPERR